ncbi:MAG: MarR family transcriptional regulator [Chitinophagales bacterium]|nr:MarR family transcriptional regulator [Chitinophagales bacterium]
MKLEQELKNSKPLQPRQRALLNIMFTASWIESRQTRFLRAYKLSGPQYNIMRILNGSYPNGLSVLEIKNRMIDRSSNVSRLVEKLRLQGLVERVQHSEDRRMVIVSISGHGKKMLSEIESAGFLSQESLPGQSLSDAEILELGHLLDKYRD